MDFYVFGHDFFHQFSLSKFSSLPSALKKKKALTQENRIPHLIPGGRPSPPGTGKGMSRCHHAMASLLQIKRCWSLPLKRCNWAVVTLGTSH